MPTYYPQLLNAMIAQPGYTPTMSFKSTIQDVDCGFRAVWAWYAGGLAGYPDRPLYEWNIPYTMLTESERATLEALQATVKGRYAAFTFLDPAGNLCQFSEDFTQAAWEKNAVSVTTAGGIGDPFGGTAASVVTSSGSNGSIDTYVLPSGGASGFVLCGSVWVKAASAQNLLIGFIDSGFGLLTSRTWTLAPGVWTRISCQVTLATASNVRLLIGGGSTWGTGVALTLFGAQCVPMLGPGIGYVKTPGDYGLHSNVRFDSDSLKWTKTEFNQNSVTVTLREFFAP